MDGGTCQRHLMCRRLGSPDVVVLAQDHASLAVTSAAVLSQLSVAAGALEAARVPVSLHREEKEAIRNSTSASRTRPASLASAAAHHCHCGRLHPAVHHSKLKKQQEAKQRRPKSVMEVKRMIKRKAPSYSCLQTDLMLW